MVSQPSASQYVVEAVGLTKIFRDFWFRTKARAVDNIDFEINRHEIFGLLGPNGSGKSTTIKMILGLLHKTRGKLSVFGRAPTDVGIKKLIGFLPEESYMYRFLNPVETLDYYGKLFELDRRTRRRRTEELLDMVGLSKVAHRPVGEFSKGMTRRIGLAQALINDPDFLILDEPTAGLDPIGTRQVKDLILDLGRRGKTVLLSSHLLADVEDVCDRMVILYGGQIRAQGTAEQLLADENRTIIESARLKPETISRIEKIMEESEGAHIDRVRAPRQRLEELFIEIVETAKREQVETSGAMHGGMTAGFLLEEVEGEGLIEGLTQEREEQVVAREAPDRRQQQEKVQREKVLDELLEEPTEKPVRAVERGEKPDAPEDVDTGLIDSLTDTKRSSDADTDQDDTDKQ